MTCWVGPERVGTSDKTGAGITNGNSTAHTTLCRRRGAQDTRAGRKGVRTTRGGARDARGNRGGAGTARVHRTRRWSDWAAHTWRRGAAGDGRPGQRAEGRSTWASRTRKRGETWSGQPGREGEWAAKPVKGPLQPPAQPPVRQLLGSADAEMTPRGTPAAAAARTHRPDVTCGGKNG